PRGRGHPARRAHSRGRRRLLGDDDDPAVSEGHRPTGGVDSARGRLRHSARRIARPRLRHRDRDGCRCAAARCRSVEGAVDPGAGRMTGSRFVAPPWIPRIVFSSVAVAVLATVAPLGFVRPASAALAAVGVADSYSTKHDRVLTVAPKGVLANDLNLLGGTTAVLVSTTIRGTLSLAPDGGFTYTPASKFVGTDRFTYRPSGLLSASATDTISVTNA